MNKLDLETPDFVATNTARLAELFPNCVTETKQSDGTLKRAIDFDLLRQELSHDLVEGAQERYRLDWPGKREALATANAPIRKTLRPYKEESVDFETTRNLYLEGDNLDALKLLQETYLGKIKMFYIDPPYNTGNDFIYDDNFSISGEEHDLLSGTRDAEGNAMFQEEKWKQNSSSNGRFHSEWLSMMYPRLKLARNLLSEDGLVFISIDEGEVSNLKKICDEIFGADNFIETFIWKKSYGGGPKERYAVTLHESILLYARNIDRLENFILPYDPEKIVRYYKLKDANHETRGPYRLKPLEATKSMDPRPNLIYAVKLPDGREISPKRQWLWGRERVIEALAKGELQVVESADGTTINYKQYLRDAEGEERGEKPFSIIEGIYTQSGTQDLRSLFDDKVVVQFPKPVDLLKKLIQIGLPSPSSDIIADFFSGSATTAHAVMQLNAEDGGKRRHIMVQLPEPCDEKSEAFKADCTTIAEIGKERIRRAGQKIRTELEEKLAKELKGSEEHTSLKSRLDSLDTGFRVLKIDSSNMADVYYQPNELTQDGLALQVDNLKPGRKPEDLLFQVLLDWGVDLALPINEETILKHRVFFVADNAVAACFDTGLDEAFVKELAKRQPLRAVFRDSGYASDAVKINFEQIFKALSPHTEIKTL